MARVVGIDHLVIRVKDFERSKAFYDTVLGFLGFKRKYTFGDTAGWSNGKTLFWIGEADAEGKKRPHRIGNIGFHHYAFELSSRRDVDGLYEVLKRHKIDVVDPAGRLSRLWRGLLRGVLHRSRRPQAGRHGVQAAAQEEGEVAKGCQVMTGACARSKKIGRAGARPKSIATALERAAEGLEGRVAAFNSCPSQLVCM